MWKDVSVWFDVFSSWYYKFKFVVFIFIVVVDVVMVVMEDV